MQNRTATSVANANIAFIKYWGRVDDDLNLPVNGSLSMNLEGLYAETQVTWGEQADSLVLNGREQTGKPLQRVVEHLDELRTRLGIEGFAAVMSENNFPTGTGIASSAAAFAALTVAGVAAAGLTLSEKQLTALARLGSGSASRSVPAGFVEWYAGTDHDSSYAESFAAPDHWDLVDVIAVVSETHKATGSTEGHSTAATSDLQAARVAGAPERLRLCKQAILDRDFNMFSTIVEHDSNLMHSVMMTSRPPLFYWLPPTLTIMQAVRDWRADGLQVCYTLDAGPNVHCLCVRKDAEQVSQALKMLSGVVDVRTARVGGGAQVISAGER
jgi:diphosphomevalonate decarboxylase